MVLNLHKKRRRRKEERYIYFYYLFNKINNCNMLSMSEWRGGEHVQQLTAEISQYNSTLKNMLTEVSL